jgi:hypothetical protein
MCVVTGLAKRIIEMAQSHEMNAQELRDDAVTYIKNNPRAGRLSGRLRRDSVKALCVLHCRVQDGQITARANPRIPTNLAAWTAS